MAAAFGSDSRATWRPLSKLDSGLIATFKQDNPQSKEFRLGKGRETLSNVYYTIAGQGLPRRQKRRLWMCSVPTCGNSCSHLLFGGTLSLELILATNTVASLQQCHPLVCLSSTVNLLTTGKSVFVALMWPWTKALYLRSPDTVKPVYLEHRYKAFKKSHSNMK